MDDAVRKQLWTKLKGVGGGVFSLLLTLSIVQGLLAGRKQSKLQKQQEEAARQQQAMMGQAIPGFGMSPGQLPQFGQGQFGQGSIPFQA